MSGQPTSSNENFDSVVPSFNGDVISNIEPVGSSLSTANSIWAIGANTTSIGASVAKFWEIQAEIQRIKEDAKAYTQKVEDDVKAYSQKLDKQSDNLAKSLKNSIESHKKLVQEHSKQIDDQIERQKIYWNIYLLKLQKINRTYPQRSCVSRGKPTLMR